MLVVNEDFVKLSLTPSIVDGMKMHISNILLIDNSDLPD